MSSFEKIRRYRQAEAKDSARRENRSLDVFLAGPFIDINKPATDADNVASIAAALRYELYSRLQAEGHVVYLGEDVQMRLNGSAHYGALSNAVVYERHHITHHSDALIVLPSSPGSFCEIGDWATTPETCKSMLLLIDEQHHGKVNYINEGVVKFAKSNGAQANYINYTDYDCAEALCKGFLMSIIHTLQVEELYGRR